MPHLRAGGAGACARRFLGPLDEAARGDAILHAREPVDSMDVVEQDETPNLADARARLEALQGLRIVLLGCSDDGPLDVAE